MYLRAPLCVFFLAGLLVLASAGCGGGGGGGGDPLLLFSGTYAIIGFEGDNDVVDTGRAQWGEITADGAGVVTGGSISENENGVLDGPTAQAASAYTIDADRNLSILSGGVPFLTGRISADGRVATLSPIAAGTTPAIIILGRKEGTYSNASLSGLYHIAMIAYSSGVPEDQVYWGQFTLAGAAGTGSGSLTINADGSTGSSGALSMTYSVAADGSATVGLSGLSLSGTVVAGGDVVLLAGSTDALEPPFMAVLIKGSAGATNALLNGSYGFTGMRMQETPASVEWTSAHFNATIIGATTISLGPGTTNEDGAVGPDSGGAADYTVSPDGTLSVNSGSLVGGVSPGGDFAVLAGDAAGGDMEFYFLVR